MGKTRRKRRNNDEITTARTASETAKDRGGAKTRRPVFYVIFDFSIKAPVFFGRARLKSLNLVDLSSRTAAIDAASIFSLFLLRNIAIYLTSRFAAGIIRLRDIVKRANDERNFVATPTTTEVKRCLKR